MWMLWTFWLQFQLKWHLVTKVYKIRCFRMTCACQRNFRKADENDNFKRDNHAELDALRILMWLSQVLLQFLLSNDVPPVKLHNALKYLLHPLPIPL
jgi:hypothetical protein